MAKHRAASPTPVAGLRPPAHGPAPSIDAPEDETESSPGEIVARPDGYHWIAPDGRQEFGPFKTLELAQAARDASDDDTPVPGETLQEAEDEIGVGDWIDPATGELAEGLCPPHLDEG